MRWHGFEGIINISDKINVFSWETKAAEFLQIEISPSHILRIKIDKERKDEEVI